MTAKAAIAKAFLQGEVLSIRTAFLMFGVSNLPREASRSIEKEFGVILERVHKTGVSQYGRPCVWHEYRLPKTDYNKDGIEKMKAYLHQQQVAVPKKGKRKFNEQELAFQ